jgi:hypothetical protein
MGMGFLKSFALALVLLFVSGCTHYELPTLPGSNNIHKKSSTVDVSGVDDKVTSKKIIVKRIPFPSDEYSELKTSGDSTVKGTIYISYNGHRITGRQTRLYLNPVTSYSNQWYRESYLAGHKMGKSSPKLFNYLKFTASNSSGEFAFYGVPAGSYYVVGTVKCSECGGKNVRIAKKVRVNGSNTVTVELGKSL